MDPYRHETMAELIVRKPGRLNIFVSRVECAPSDDSIPSKWHSVFVRYSYSELYLPGDERPTRYVIPTLGDWFDPQAINNAGNKGGFRAVPDVAEIEAAIARLRDVWGPLHVQDHSGVVPHLDQGAWQR